MTPRCGHKALLWPLQPSRSASLLEMPAAAQATLLTAISALSFPWHVHMGNLLHARRKEPAPATAGLQAVFGLSCTTCKTGPLTWWGQVSWHHCTDLLCRKFAENVGIEYKTPEAVFG